VEIRPHGAQPGVSPELIGRQVSHYRVLEWIGGGGMGDVYRAEDVRLDRRVALKFLPRARIGSRDALARFEREARTVASLNHPNVCTLLDVGEHEGQPFLVMELVEGQTLRQLLYSRQLTLDEVVQLGAEIGDALEAAHRKSILHRDVKPSNLFVDEGGHVKVLDFGLAKLMEGVADPPSEAPTASEDPGDPHGLTGEGRAPGTVGYMSPEQALGQQLDARSDVFALGVVLYEMATGERAFPGASAGEIVSKIVHQDPVPPTELRREIPTGLEDVILSALEKERSLRTQTAGEVRAELLRLQRRSSASSSDPTGRRYVAPRRPTRRRALIAAAGLALAASAVAVWYRSRAVAEPSSAASPVAVVVSVATSAPQAELASGVAEIVAQALTRVPGINVIRSTASSPVGQARDPSQIARELGADYLVEPTVRRDQGRVEIDVKLERIPAPGSVIWSRHYAGSDRDLPQLAGRAALELAQALHPRLTASERLAVGRSHPMDPALFERYSQAIAFLERQDVAGNVDRATELLEAVVAADPGFALAQAALGRACLRKYDETKEASWIVRAQTATETAVRLDPDQVLARVTLAEIYGATGRLEQAKTELQRALQQQPGSDAIHLALGRLLAKEGQLDEAIARLQQAVSLRPNYWENHQALGAVHFRAGHYPQAEASFKRVVELQPDNAWGHEMLATVYHVTGDVDRALDSYRRAVQLGPDSIAFANMGALLYSQGRLREAAAAFDSAARLSPGEPANYRNLGDAYRRLGDEAKAKDAYTRVVALCEEQLRVDPNSASTLAALAVSEAKLGRFAAARRHAEQAIGRAPTDPDVLYKKAVVCALAGDRETALSTLDLAIRHGYSRTLARDDEDLGLLKGSRELERLLAASD